MVCPRKCLGERAVAHGGPGIEELCDWLIARTHRRHTRGNWRGHRNDAGPRRRSLVGTRFLRLWDQSQAARSVPRPLHRGRRQEPALAKAGDDRRDARVLADSLRTDRHAFRRLSNDEPVIVKLREWSRMTDDLQQERIRLASRMREQLWRYYPQMLELADDLAADWFLDLWNQAPTPAKAARLRQTTIERFIKVHRLRRWQAPEVLRILKQKPLSVAPGVVEAASDHIRPPTRLPSRPTCRGAGPLQVLKTRGFAGESRQASPVRPVYNADQPITALKGTGIRTLGPPLR